MLGWGGAYVGLGERIILGLGKGLGWDQGGANIGAREGFMLVWGSG